MGKFPISKKASFLYDNIVRILFHIISTTIKIGKANGAPPVSGPSGFDSHPEIF